jgi:hypothetical protein
MLGVRALRQADRLAAFSSALVQVMVGSACSSFLPRPQRFSVTPRIHYGDFTVCRTGTTSS